MLCNHMRNLFIPEPTDSLFINEFALDTTWALSNQTSLHCAIKQITITQLSLLAQYGASISNYAGNLQ